MTIKDEALRGVLGGVLCNAANFPEKVSIHILGQEMGPLIDRTAAAVLAAGYRKDSEVATRTPDLDEIEAQTNAASPGPWETSSFDSGHSRFERSISIVAAHNGDTIADMNGLARSHNEDPRYQDDGWADAVFIANARSYVPELIAEVDHLTAQLLVAQAAIMEALAANEHRPDLHTIPIGILSRADTSALAEHDRQVAEKAWDNGRASTGIMYPSNPPQYPQNPHRAEVKSQ